MRFNGGMQQHDKPPENTTKQSHLLHSEDLRGADHPGSEYAFHTIDGSPLTFCYPWDGREKRIRAESLRFDLIPEQRKAGLSYNHIKVFSETFFPKLQHVIFLDIDSIPAVYSDKDKREEAPLRIASKWDQVAVDLRARFAGKGHVFTSRSGRLKVAFVVEVLYPQQRLPKKVATEFLKWIAEDLLDGADRGKSGLFTSFIIESEIEAFRAAISTLTPIKIDLTGWPLLSSEDFFNPQRIGDKTDRCFTPLKALPPEFEGVCLTWNARKLLRCLCALPGLVRREGYDLPQDILANSTGIDQSSVSRLLRQFQKRGLIRRLDSSFRPGVKAKTYRARGLLKMAILGRLAEGGYALPTEIADGTWNDNLLAACAYFTRKGRLDKYMEWFYTLPNCSKKDRPRKAAAILKWFSKLPKAKRN